MVLILLLLFCNHDNLILKLHQKKSIYLDEGWLFIGSFKVGSVPRMTNNQLKNCLSRKIWKNHHLMYVEERGWVNAQILFTNC